MRICNYTLEDFTERVQAFHGSPGPGLIIGWFMVNLAYQNVPEEGFLDAICETPRCLPDVIQLLTPCTVGNGWLTIIEVGRFAMTLYDKSTGEGIRVFLDSGKLDAWPELKSWFFKLKPKREQNGALLTKEIKEAGSSICSVQRVKVAERFMKKKRQGRIAVCPKCHEGYPVHDGDSCLVCQGKERPYEIAPYWAGHSPFIAEKRPRNGSGIG